MDVKDKILGSLHGAIIGEMMGQLTSEKADVSSMDWLKEQVYVNNHVMQVFSKDYQRIDQVPNEAYLKYILWMSKKNSLNQESGIQKINQKDFLFLNQLLNEAFNDSVKEECCESYIPIVLEFSDLKTHMKYHEYLLNVSGCPQSNIQVHYCLVMYLLGRYEELDQVLEIAGQLEDSIDQSTGWSENMQLRDYRRIMEIAKETDSFENGLEAILHQVNDPIRFGMLSGNLLGKVFGASGIPDYYMNLIKEKCI